MVRAASFILVGISLPQAAFALDPPYSWGVGPRLGTMVLPGSFPISFPNKIDNYDFDDVEGRDVDERGNELFTSLERARGDVSFGLDGVYAINKDWRVGGYAGAGVGLGTRFSDLHFMLRGEYVLAQTDDFVAAASGAIGVGQWVFDGAVGDEKLKIPYYPIRAGITGELLDGPRAYGLTVWGQYGVPGNHFYTDQAGNAQDVSAPLNYLAAGVELGVWFGDFTAPKAGKKKGGKKPGKGGGKPGGKRGGKPGE